MPVAPRHDISLDSSFRKRLRSTARAFSFWLRKKCETRRDEGVKDPARHRAVLEFQYSQQPGDGEVRTGAGLSQVPASVLLLSASGVRLHARAFANLAPGSPTSENRLLSALLQPAGSDCGFRFAQFTLLCAESPPQAFQSLASASLSFRQINIPLAVPTYKLPLARIGWDANGWPRW